jgi:hypothetical protein
MFLSLSQSLPLSEGTSEKEVKNVPQNSENFIGTKRTSRRSCRCHMNLIGENITNKKWKYFY